MHMDIADERGRLHARDALTVRLRSAACRTHGGAGMWGPGRKRSLCIARAMVGCRAIAPASMTTALLDSHRSWLVVAAAAGPIANTCVQLVPLTTYLLRGTSYGPHVTLPHRGFTPLRRRCGRRVRRPRDLHSNKHELTDARKCEESARQGPL